MDQVFDPVEDGPPPVRLCDLDRRKQMLWWMISAGRPETRARRIAKIVQKAALGERAAG